MKIIKKGKMYKKYGYKWMDFIGKRNGYFFKGTLKFNNKTQYFEQW